MSIVGFLGCNDARDEPLDDHHAVVNPSVELSIRAELFNNIRRSAKAIEGSCAVGVSHEKFHELLQEFATELLLVKENLLNRPENEVATQYADALSLYKDSSVLWIASMRMDGYLGGETIVFDAKGNLPANPWDAKSDVTLVYVDEELEEIVKGRDIACVPQPVIEDYVKQKYNHQMSMHLAALKVWLKNTSGPAPAQSNVVGKSRSGRIYEVNDAAASAKYIESTSIMLLWERAAEKVALASELIERHRDTE